MKTKILLTMALVAGLMLAGCSKSDDELAPQYKLTKDNIVGVWRSGDYWVSFSEDGYNSSFFPIENDERINEGAYTINGDTITVANSLYYCWTRYVVNSISSTDVSLTLIYNFYETTGSEKDNYETTKTLTLTKTNETPSHKMDLDGKSFTCESTFYNTKNKQTYHVTQINPLWAEYHLIQHQNHYDSIDEERIDGNWSGGQKYYVYLSPYIYTVLLHIDTYERNTTVIKGEISVNSDGSLDYTPVN